MLRFEEPYSRQPEEVGAPVLAGTARLRLAVQLKNQLQPLLADAVPPNQQWRQAVYQSLGAALRETGAMSREARP